MNPSETKIPSTRFTIQQPSLDVIKLKSGLSKVGVVSGTCASFFSILLFLPLLLIVTGSGTISDTDGAILMLIAYALVGVFIEIIALYIYRTSFPYTISFHRSGKVVRDTFILDTKIDMNYSYIILETDIDQHRTDSGQKRIQIKFSVRVAGISKDKNDLKQFALYSGRNKQAAQKLAYILSYALNIPVVDFRVQVDVFKSYIKRINEEYDGSEELLAITPLNSDNRVSPKEANIDKLHKAYHINDVPEFSLPLKELSKTTGSLMVNIKSR